MFHFSGNNIPYLASNTKEKGPGKKPKKQVTMKDFKSFHRHEWKLRISVRGFRFKREDNLPKEAEEANLSLYPYGDLSSASEWFYKEIYPNITEGCHCIFQTLRLFPATWQFSFLVRLKQLMGWRHMQYFTHRLSLIITLIDVCQAYRTHQQSTC